MTPAHRRGMLSRELLPELAPKLARELARELAPKLARELARPVQLRERETNLGGKFCVPSTGNRSRGQRGRWSTAAMCKPAVSSGSLSLLQRSG